MNQEDIQRALQDHSAKLNELNDVLKEVRASLMLTKDDHHRRLGLVENLMVSVQAANVELGRSCQESSGRLTELEGRDRDGRGRGGRSGKRISEQKERLDQVSGYSGPGDFLEFTRQMRIAFDSRYKFSGRWMNLMKTITMPDAASMLRLGQEAIATEEYFKEFMAEL